MKRSLVLLLIPILAVPCALFGATNDEARISFGEKRPIHDSALSAMPIIIDNAESLRAYTLVFRYRGDITGASFAPSTFLFEPLTMQPRIEEGSNRFSVSVTSTKNVLPDKESGVLGELRVDADSPSFTVEIVELQLLDEDFNLDIIRLDDDQSEDTKFDNDSRSDSDITETRIYQTYPNPANPSTTITFSIRETCHVRLAIYNVNGQLIRSLIDGRMNSGAYDITWNGTDNNGNQAQSGIYFCRFRAGGYSDGMKILLLK